MPEAQDRLFLTERRRPLIKSNLTGLFLRLSQRAGLSETPICPSMLRDTYAVRFLQAGGDVPALQKQLGVAHPASVRRYHRFYEQQRAETEVQAVPEERTKPSQSARRSKGKRRTVRGRR
jgi:site-specific recombinase XerD